MALPTTITGAVWSALDRWIGGPFLSSSGNVYFVVTTGIATVAVYKATDPTSSFAEADAANHLVTSNNIHAVASTQSGDVLHIAAQENSTGRVSYSTFNMASDAWAIVNEEAVVTGDGSAVYNCINISLRSNGNVVVLYAGAREAVTMTNYARVKYARRVSGVWTVNVAVDNGGEAHWIAGVIVLGSSDRMHLFFKDDTNVSGYQRSLASDNTLQSFPASFDTGMHGDNRCFGQGFAYVFDGATKVRVPYRGATPESRVAKMDSADTPTVTTTTGLTDTATVNNSTIIAAAVKGEDHYVLMRRASDADLYYIKSTDGGATFGADQSLWATITCARLICNVFVRGGNYRLAFVARDSATAEVRYDELDLGAAATFMPRQNAPILQAVTRAAYH